jgi:hypothetical protein
VADDVSVVAGAATYTAATDEVAAGIHAPLVKLLYSASGVRTAVQADADGLLVNLGTNNDVVVTNAGTFVVQNTPARASTATLANVSGSASSVTLQASNASRRALIVVNDSTAICYVKYGSSAATDSYTHKLHEGESFREEVYSGIVTGIWASATGAARMTEIT